MNILADASLPGLIEDFPEPFHLTYYRQPDEIQKLLPGQDVLLCRSTLKINAQLLQNHQLRYVATASSGTDHLDHDWLATQKIQIIDAKGSNACSVADYVVASLAYLEQHQLPQGKKAGIIGLGKVGTQVQERLQTAGFKVLTYDPLKALHEPFQSCDLKDLWQVDLLCIHAELHDTEPYPSVNLINYDFLSHLKPGCVILNAARGGIVNEEDLLNTQQKFTYCTDVYWNEPAVDKRILQQAFLCTPHIAGHSLEAKYAAVAMISATLHQILGLENPKFAVPKITEVQKPGSILSIYNPLEETLLLKNAEDIATTFLKVRKDHQKRHDFWVYDRAWNSNRDH